MQIRHRIFKRTGVQVLQFVLGENSDNFDVSLAFLPLTVAKLSMLKNSAVFLGPPCTYTCPPCRPIAVCDVCYVVECFLAHPVHIPAHPVGLYLRVMSVMFRRCSVTWKNCFHCCWKHFPTLPMRYLPFNLLRMCIIYLFIYYTFYAHVRSFTVTVKNRQVWASHVSLAEGATIQSRFKSIFSCTAMVKKLSQKWQFEEGYSTL